MSRCAMSENHLHVHLHLSGTARMEFDGEKLTVAQLASETPRQSTSVTLEQLQQVLESFQKKKSEATSA